MSCYCYCLCTQAVCSLTLLWTHECLTDHYTTHYTLGIPGTTEGLHYRPVGVCMYAVPCTQRVLGYPFNPLSHVAPGMHTGPCQEEPHVCIATRTPTRGQGHPLTLNLLLELIVLPDPAIDQFLEQAKLGILERAGLEPTTYWLQVSHSTHCAMTASCHSQELRYLPTQHRSVSV